MADGRLRSSLDVIAALSMSLASIVFIWGVVTGRKPGPLALRQSASSASSASGLPAEPIDLAMRGMAGTSSAGVGVLIYSDFECPFCGKFARETLPVIMAEFVKTGRITLSFRHLPLTRIHPNALKAAEAAECAGVQGRFWEMHDALFRLPKELAPSTILSKAGAIGLNRIALESCLEGEGAARVNADVEEARKLQVRGTPTFFFGTVRAGKLHVVRRESGAMPASVFGKILSELTDPGS